MKVRRPLGVLASFLSLLFIASSAFYADKMVQYPMAKINIAYIIVGQMIIIVTIFVILIINFKNSSLEIRFKNFQIIKETLYFLLLLFLIYRIIAEYVRRSDILLLFTKPSMLDATFYFTMSLVLTTSMNDFFEIFFEDKNVSIVSTLFTMQIFAALYAIGGSIPALLFLLAITIANLISAKRRIEVSEVSLPISVLLIYSIFIYNWLIYPVARNSPSVLASDSNIILSQVNNLIFRKEFFFDIPTWGYPSQGGLIASFYALILGYNTPIPIQYIPFLVLSLFVISQINENLKDLVKRTDVSSLLAGILFYSGLAFLYPVFICHDDPWWCVCKYVPALYCSPLVHFAANPFKYFYLLIAILGYVLLIKGNSVGLWYVAFSGMAHTPAYFIPLLLILLAGARNDIIKQFKKLMLSVLSIPMFPLSIAKFIRAMLSSLSVIEEINMYTNAFCFSYILIPINILILIHIIKARKSLNHGEGLTIEKRLLIPRFYVILSAIYLSAPLLLSIREYPLGGVIIYTISYIFMFLFTIYFEGIRKLVYVASIWSMFALLYFYPTWLGMIRIDLGFFILNALGLIFLFYVASDNPRLNVFTILLPFFVYGSMALYLLPSGTLPSEQVDSIYHNVYNATRHLAPDTLVCYVSFGGIRDYYVYRALELNTLYLPFDKCKISYPKIYVLYGNFTIAKRG
jgi:hypothetical protein